MEVDVSQIYFSRHFYYFCYFCCS